jgi:pilus assembly protein Flp/PilA
MIIRFLRDEAGGTALEYALIASLISIAIVGSITQWSDAVVALFALVQDAFTPG